jgi:uncharacterized RDD family membrane protein YckC
VPKKKVPSNQAKASKFDTCSGEGIPTEVKLASFGKRLFAWVYDLLGALGIFILALVIGQVTLYLVTLPWVDEFNQVSIQASKSPFWALYLLLAVQYYYAWCWVKGGQTVGMKAWRLQLYRSDGQMVNWKQAYVRSLFSLGGLANLWCLFDQEKRGLHDFYADTRVVELPKDFYSKKPQKPLI